MITLTKLSKKRYEVFLEDGTCLGDFSRHEVGVDPFLFYSIQFRYNTKWTAELLRELSEKLTEVNNDTPMNQETPSTEPKISIVSGGLAPEQIYANDEAKIDCSPAAGMSFAPGGEPVLQLTREGFIYRGEVIEDAGQAHSTFLDYLSSPLSMPNFWRQQAVWSEHAFGPTSERGPIGPLKHLAKEAVEAQKDPGDLMEYVDCLFLVFDATRRAGFSYQQLLDGAFQKLEINKARVWKRTGNPDEPVEHDRSRD